MESFGSIVIIAFTLQLMALPGEKAQLVIGGLSTRYEPLPVVGGATIAFGVWTIIEIVVGKALSEALPPVYLDGLTVGLFIVFASWLLYSNPENSFINPVNEVGTESRFVNYFSESSGFGPSLLAISFGEFGDKTQLITIGLAAQYGVHAGIWIGEMLAIVPFSLLMALGFRRISSYIEAKWVHWGAATMFLVFAADITSEYIVGNGFLPI